jgi:hypothetical protein
MEAAQPVSWFTIASYFFRPSLISFSRTGTGRAPRWRTRKVVPIAPPQDFFSASQQIKRVTQRLRRWARLEDLPPTACIADLLLLGGFGGTVGETTDQKARCRYEQAEDEPFLYRAGPVVVHQECREQAEGDSEVKSSNSPGGNGPHGLDCRWGLRRERYGTRASASRTAGRVAEPRTSCRSSPSRSRPYARSAGFRSRTSESEALLRPRLPR